MHEKHERKANNYKFKEKQQELNVGEGEWKTKEWNRTEQNRGSDKHLKKK